MYFLLELINLLRFFLLQLFACLLLLLLTLLLQSESRLFVLFIVIFESFELGDDFFLISVVFLQVVHERVEVGF